MGIKGKIISTCVMIALTLCSAVAIGFAYSNPGINISSPTSFNVDDGVQASVSTTIAINGENVDLENGVGSLTIEADSSESSYDLDLPKQVFTKIGDKIVYTYTITNTKTDSVGSDFIIGLSFDSPSDSLASSVSVTSSFSELSADEKLLTKDESVSITFTLELLSESTSFDFDPSIQFTLTKA